MEKSRFCGLVCLVLSVFVAWWLVLSRVDPVLAAGGGPLGDALDVSDLGGVDEKAPDVAYNPDRNEYLLVWYNDRAGNDDIYGRRVSAHGQPIGSSWFAISAQPGSDRRNPKVAYNSATQTYLVVWEAEVPGEGTGILGRQVSATGQVLGATDYVYARNTVPTDSYFEPVVAYASVVDRFVLVYHFERTMPNTQAILGVELKADGTEVAGASTIEIVPFTTPDAPALPDLAYNRARNEFLVVWEQGSVDRDVFARRLKMQGGADVLGASFSVRSIGRTTKPVVAAIPDPPGQGQYLVAWETDVAGVPWIEGQLVAGEGSLTGTRFSVSDTGQSTSPAVAGSEAGTTYTVAWRQNDYVPMFIWDGILARDVSMVGDLDPVTEIGGILADQPTATAGATGDVYIVFEDQPLLLSRDIYGQLWGRRAYLPLILR